MKNHIQNNKQTVSEETNLITFIRGTQNYFSSVTGATPEVGTPYLIDEKNLNGDYTASIGITGTQHGNVFFTAKREMLQNILKQLGEFQADEDLYGDLVGEIANTIAGNAREDLGGGFMISSPHLESGAPTQSKLFETPSSFVIPIHWKGHACFVVISLHAIDSRDSSSSLN